MLTEYTQDANGKSLQSEETHETSIFLMELDRFQMSFIHDKDADTIG